MDLVEISSIGRFASGKITLAGQEIDPVGIRREDTVSSAVAGEGRYLTDAKQLGKLFLSNANARVDDLTAASRRKRDHWI